MTDSSSLSAPDSEEFMNWVASQKESFSDRTTFNYFVCDELARRGIQPNSLNVVKVGRWGNSNAVAADVRTWFSNIAARLAERYPQIPNASQAEANSLIEKLWSLALRDAKEPIAAAIKQADDLHEKLNIALDAISVSKTAMEEQARIHHLDADKFKTEINLLNNKLLAANDTIITTNLEKTGLEKSLKGATSRISEINEQTRNTVLRIEASHKASLEIQNAAHEKAIANLNQALQRSNQQNEVARRDFAMQIDLSRQDAKSANERAATAEFRTEKVRGEVNALRDELANQRIAMARIDQDLSHKTTLLKTEKELFSASQTTIQELQKQIANLSATVASQNIEIAQMKIELSNATKNSQSL